MQGCQGSAPQRGQVIRYAFPCFFIFSSRPVRASHALAMYVDELSEIVRLTNGIVRSSPDNNLYNKICQALCIGVHKLAFFMLFSGCCRLRLDG